MITQDKVQSLFNYDSETGIFTRKVKTTAKTKIGDVVGYDNKNGYKKISIDNKLYFSHRLAWLYVYGVWPEKGLDHINRNRSDNRLCNLRLANQSENTQNTAIRKNNTSGYKGVTFCKNTNKWISQIMINYKHIYIGKYETPEIAYEQYINMAKKLHTHNSVAQM
jgi:hypothetical protein